MDIPRHWRLQKERYGLVGSVCDCGKKLFPYREVCLDCASKSMQDSDESKVFENFNFSNEGAGLVAQAIMASV